LAYSAATSGLPKLPMLMIRLSPVVAAFGPVGPHPADCGRHHTRKQVPA
jgi:hypothetical protein